jgi:hypothetical protein
LTGKSIWRRRWLSAEKQKQMSLVVWKK